MYFILGLALIGGIVACVAQLKLTDQKYNGRINHLRTEVTRLQDQKHYLDGQLSNLKPNSVTYDQKLKQLVEIVDQKATVNTKLNRVMAEKAANN